MRFSFVQGFGVFTLLICGVVMGCAPASAAITATEYRAAVRIDMALANGKTTPLGSGVVIDQDGRILTSYSAISKLVSAKTTKALICIAKDERTPPVCNFEATIIKSNPSIDLALLQIQRIHSQGLWRSVEEEKLRAGLSFTRASIEKATSSEMVRLSDTVYSLDFPTNVSSSVRLKKSSVTNYEQKTVSGKTSPWLIKTDAIATSKSLGGPVFNEQNKLVGMLTNASGTTNGYNSFISLPVLNIFLKETLGINYVNNKFSFVFDGNFSGILGGNLLSMTTANCPESSRYDALNKSCTCNNGFFAVGNACILGADYCQIMYPKGSTYDIFLKSCLCQINGESKICPQSLRKVINPPTKPAAPKPTTTTPATPPVKATTTKPVASVTPKPTSTPAIKPTTPTSTQTAIEIACKKQPGHSYLKKTNTCVPVGVLSKQTDLGLCEIVAVPATKLFFPKGNSFIKKMTYKYKVCFVDETSAVKAGYKKTTTK